jgi:hypothetical protein
VTAARRSHHRAAALVAAAVGALAGCGREAPPLPPEIRVAEQTRDLAAYQEAEEAVLTFAYPAMTSAGGALPDLEAVEVWRAHLPPTQEPRGTSTRDRQLASQLLAGRGELVLTLDRAGLDAATRGPTLEVRDPLREWYQAHQEEMPLVLWYAVRSICCGDRPSSFSNIARLEPQLPPDPPADLTLAADATGVRLGWTAAEGVGVVVERTADGGRWETLTAEPVSAGEWLDSSAVQGQTLSYRLRSVRLLDGGGRVVGAPGAALEVEHLDVYPPPPPVALVCLPEGRTVLLRWEGSSEATLYRVLRQRDGGPWVHLDSDRKEPELTDAAPPLGSLTYAVKAVDGAGNESEAARCATVVGGEAP